MKATTENSRKQLDYFEGTWHTTGQVLAGEDDGRLIEGLDTYEWLPGRHFLMHTVDALVGEKREHTVEMIGYDPEAKTVIGRTFGSDGNYGQMSFDLRGDEILINGPELRFNGRFNDEFNKISGIWETTTHGSWKAIMEVTLTKRS